MTERIDLRAYRDNIARRLAAAGDAPGAPALLDVESGGERWLVDLPAAGEVLPVPSLTPVPMTHDWFAGLANVHGELETVVDFARFCGAAPTPRTPAARLLRIGSQSGAGVCLLVERVQGLRHTDTLTCHPADRADRADPADPPQPDWHGATYDSDNRRWTRLELDRLLADPRFLDAALSDPS
jgi:twitching motility protein PilI